MHGSSRGSAKAVQAAFDAVLAQGSSWAPLADELFAVTAVVDGSASLRRALADPSREAAEKQGLARAVFGAKVGQTTTALVGEVAGQRWSAERDLGDTLEALAVMSLLATAERAGHIDRVEDELFRFERAPRGRRLDRVMAAYLALASTRRDELTALVTAATPLTEQQSARLRSALESHYGKSVSLQVVQDPTVMGGIRVQVGDEVVDGTVLRRLDQARRHVTGG